MIVLMSEACPGQSTRVSCISAKPAPRHRPVNEGNRRKRWCEGDEDRPSHSTGSGHDCWVERVQGWAATPRAATGRTIKSTGTMAHAKKGTASRTLDVLWRGDTKAREPKVECDAPRLLLRTPVEGSRGADGAHGLGKRGLAAVNVSQNSHVDVQERPAHGLARGFFRLRHHEGCRRGSQNQQLQVH